MRAISPHTGSMEFSLRRAARMPSVHRPRFENLDGGRQYDAPLAAPTRCPCSRCPCSRCPCSRCPCPGPLGPVGARGVEAGLDERRLDGAVRPQVLVGADARIGRQRGGDVQLARRPEPPAPIAQCAAVIVSSMSVTAPLRASARRHRDAVVDRDRRQRQDVAGQDGAGPEGGGASDLPEHVAGLRAVDELDLARRRGGQRRAGLEDEDGVRVALGVERERPGQPERRRVLVDARREREPAEVRGRRHGRGPSGGVVVGDREVRLRLECDRVGRVLGPGDGAGPEAGDRRAGLSPRLPLIVDGPVLVTVVPARTAKLSAVPRPSPVRTTLVFPVSSPLTWSGLRSGRAWSRSAAAPATTGAAIDVPPIAGIRRRRRTGHRSGTRCPWPGAPRCARPGRAPPAWRRRPG